jgi:hypothetical protein
MNPTLGLLAPGCNGTAVGTADFCYDPTDEKDGVSNVETKTVDDEEVPNNAESESSSRSTEAKLTISFVVLGVTIPLMVGFWLYKRRTAEKGGTTAQAGAEIQDGPTSPSPHYKEQETESDDEPTTLTT